MRLIDADALNTKLQKEIGSPIDEKLYAVNMCIIAAPTIEAIPLEWLKERLRKEIDAVVLGTGTRAGKAIANSVFNVLELWKADKRRQEAKA